MRGLDSGCGNSWAYAVKLAKITAITWSETTNSLAFGAGLYRIDPCFSDNVDIAKKALLLVLN